MPLEIQLTYFSRRYWGKGMKIALVYDSIYPFIKGGGEKRFYEIGKRLSGNGHEVHLYGMKLWSGKDVIKKDNLYLHGICKAKPLYVDKGRRSISQAIYFGMNCIKLIKEDFDVIDCCGFPYFSLFTCKIVCMIKGKPMYSTYHEVWGRDYWKSYLGKLGIIGYLVEKISSRLPNKIIAVSENTKKQLIEKLNVNPNKIIVIENGADISKIQKIKPSKESSDIIYAGRLLDYKNIDVLIKAIAIIKSHRDHPSQGDHPKGSKGRKSNPNIKCIIIGDGPELQNLKNLTKQLKLDNNIIFKGFVKKIEDVYALIKSSKVFVLPSTREGFGIVVVEANACGIPVITTSHKDNASKDLIKQGKNGFICKLNEKDIADKIKTAIKQSQKMKKDCLSSAKHYDWQNIIKKFEGVYNG